MEDMGAPVPVIEKQDKRKKKKQSAGVRRSQKNKKSPVGPVGESQQFTSEIKCEKHSKHADIMCMHPNCLLAFCQYCMIEDKSHIEHFVPIEKVFIDATRDIKMLNVD